MRRIDDDSDGSYRRFMIVTDSQFSVVAALSASQDLTDRTVYDSYGTARHHRPKDVDGDGDMDSSDRSAIVALNGKGIADAGYTADADLDRNGVINNADRDLIPALSPLAALPAGWISTATGCDSPAGYDGYEFNPETNLYCVRFRWYDSGLGRWMERDPLQSIAGPNRYQYTSSAPIGRIDGSGLWDVAGHFWTAFILARCTGQDVDKALELAYYTQLPDRVDDFNAVPAGRALEGDALAISGPKLTAQQRQYLLDVQEVLHSLHGGDAAAVEKRQRCLEKLYNKGRESMSPWQRGFLFHALGDSFAHVDSKGKAYQSPEGHLLDGHDPDIISKHKYAYNIYCIMSCQNGMGKPFPISKSPCNTLLDDVPADETEEQARERLKGIAKQLGLTDDMLTFDPTAGVGDNENYAMPTHDEVAQWLESIRKELKCCEEQQPK